MNFNKKLCNRDAGREGSAWHAQGLGFEEKTYLHTSVMNCRWSVSVPNT